MKALESNPTYWKIISALALVLFITLSFKLVFPTFRQWTALSREIAGKQEQAAISADWHNTLKQLNNEYKRLEKKFEAINTSHSSLNSLAETVRLLNDTAGQNDINIESIRPGKEKVFETHKQRAMHISLRGDYFSIGRFMAELEERNYNILFKETDITSGENKLTADIKLSMITLKESL